MSMRGSDIDAAAKDTCEWLNQHSIYKAWLNMHQGILWVKGKPGSGKSTMMKHALQITEQVNNLQGRALTSYFFHGRGIDLQKSTLGLFRSVLHQILDQIPDFLTEFANIFGKKEELIGPYDQSWQWEEGELRDLFKSFVTKAAETIGLRIYVDALDECSTTDAKSLLKIFREMMRAPLEESALQVCLSCQHYPLIALPDWLEISMENENKRDIERYVTRELDQNLQNQGLVEKLGKIILPKASGVFQWVVLIVRMASDLYLDGTHEEDICDAVRNKPTELSELYHDLMQTIIPEKRVETLQIMQWIQFSKRPLRITELRHALAIQKFSTSSSLEESLLHASGQTDEEFERRLRDRTKGLVELTEVHARREDFDSYLFKNDKVIQFIHQSVADFVAFEGIKILNTSWDASQSMAGQAHFLISRTCVNLIIMEQSYRRRNETFDSHGIDDDKRGTIEISTFKPYSQRLFREIFQGIPLLPYATRYWITHTKDVEGNHIPQADLLDLFDWPSRKIMSRWSRNFELLPPDGSGGEERTLDGREREERKRKGRYDDNLLHIALRYGLSSVVRSCLEIIDNGNLEAGVNEVNGDSEAALILALRAGHLDIVKSLLLRGDINVNVRSSYGATPLLIAIKECFYSILTLLLSRTYIDVNARDKEGTTPLMCAVQAGSLDVVKALLSRHDIDVNARNCRDRSPLNCAIWRSRSDVVKVLLERTDIDINTTTSPEIITAITSPGTPLSYVVDVGNLPVVEALLARDDVDVNAQGHDQKTPLSWAAWKGSLAVVQALLARDDIDVNARSDASLTPLSYAVMGGNCDIVKILLERTDLSASKLDEKRRSPLTYAARNGPVAIIKTLIQRADLDRNARDIFGRTPLSYAAERGDAAVVEVILARNGVNRKVSSQTPLSHTAGGTVNALDLRQDADINTRDSSGVTPWAYASRHGHIAIVKALISMADIDINCPSFDGMSPLRHAVESLLADITKLLLKQPGIENCPLMLKCWSCNNRKEYYCFLQSLLECDELDLVDLDTGEPIDPKVLMSLRNAVEGQRQSTIELIRIDQTGYRESGSRRKIGFAPKPEGK
ncbi:MAG: hypothetical protein Q9160_001947 [Pyrenula sp. 1 TL-2023]